MEANFRKYPETVFEHTEIISAGVRNIAIARENMEDAGKQNVPEASCIILTGSDRRQAVENRCTPQ